jgi:hypothetical protein
LLESITSYRRTSLAKYFSVAADTSCLLKTSSTNDSTSALFVDNTEEMRNALDPEQKSRHNRQSIDRNRNIAMGISES